MMRRIFLTTLLLLLTASFAQADSLLLNGSFETPVLAVDASDNTSYYMYRPTGSGWTFSGNSGVAANSLGNPATFDSNAHTGNQFAFLQGSAPLVSQSFTLALASDLELSFWLADRYLYTNQTVQVLIDNAVVGTCAATRAYVEYVIDLLNVTAGEHTIAFAGLGNNICDVTAVLDDVNLSITGTHETPNPSGVPEPASMLLLGFGLIGLAGLKKRFLKK